jgi:hypothetical protein
MAGKPRNRDAHALRLAIAEHRRIAQIDHEWKSDLHSRDHRSFVLIDRDGQRTSVRAGMINENRKREKLRKLASELALAEMVVRKLEKIIKSC